MKKLFATAAIAMALGLTAGTAQAGNVVLLHQDGNDLMIVNNGDGSDFLAVLGNRRMPIALRGD